MGRWLGGQDKKKPTVTPTPEPWDATRNRGIGKIRTKTREVKDQTLAMLFGRTVKKPDKDGG